MFRLLRRATIKRRISCRHHPVENPRCGAPLYRRGTCVRKKLEVVVAVGTLFLSTKKRPTILLHEQEKARHPLSQNATNFYVLSGWLQYQLIESRLGFYPDYFPSIRGLPIKGKYPALRLSEPRISGPVVLAAPFGCFLCVSRAARQLWLCTLPGP